MDTDVMLAVGTVLVGVITTVMLALIPWAYTVNGRLTRIETELKFFRQQVPTDVASLLARIEKRLETERT